MSSSNLAEKYRPRSLDDLVGQTGVVRTIGNAMKNGNLHHAYLFVGQFGSGKTTAARIVPAMENCLTSPGLHPCGKCKICKAIFEKGKHTDIEEIDAASGAGKVDQIRELKASALYNPVDGCKTKYYIIDEAHRMSDQAIDALLKVLEEPPAHVRFILLTTDPQRLRPAVVSRCQRHDFRQIYWTQIAERLKYVAKEEGIQIDDDAINLCARMAKGSMRVGLQHLEKAISFSGNGHVTLEHVQSMFGTLGEGLYYDLIDEILGVAPGKVNGRNGFHIINEMLRNGTEFSIIYDGIADHLRQVLVATTASGAGDFISLTQEGKERLSKQVRVCKEKMRLNAIVISLKSLIDAKMSVDYNLSPEIALQQWFVESVVSACKPSS